MKLYLRERTLEIPAPLVMGIVNVTPDSFSDGGKFFSADRAFAQARVLTTEGAHIVDVGGESTRPGARKVSAGEEIDRILPVIAKIKRELQVLVSVDTYKADVARCAVEEGGADMVNDISALDFSPDMGETVARLKIPVILMHIKGTPENMQANPFYDDVVGEISGYFRERILRAEQLGIGREKILLDPGIGFGKRVEDNIRIVKDLRRFESFGLPLVIGLSRKSFLGKITGEENPEKREAETLAASIMAILNGVSVVRVHEVRPMVSAIKVLRELSGIPFNK